MSTSPPVTLPTDATPVARARSGVVIGRYQGTVVVTVHGELDLPRAEHLDLVLADLIDGQGNLSIIVDLRDVTATATDAERVELFEDAAGRARRHRGTVMLSQPPALLHEALRRRGIGHLVVTPDTLAASGWKASIDTGSTHQQVRVAPPRGGRAATAVYGGRFLPGAH